MPEEQSQQQAQAEEKKTDRESEMKLKPKADDPQYRGSGKLQGKVALITGGDSGIGRAVAIAYAKEGANVAIVYLKSDDDAKETKQMVEQLGGRATMISGDIGDEAFCQQAVQQTVDEFGQLDILVNNAAEQHPQKSIEDISAQQLERTFRTNIFSMFFMTKAALKHLKQGSVIINTTSVTAYQGSKELLDLLLHQGSDRCLYPLLVRESDFQGNSCQWRSTRPNLDTTNSLNHASRKS